MNMKRSSLLSACLALSCAVVCPVFAAPAAGGAKELVQARLRGKGMETGIDADSGRYVFVGTCSRVVKDPASNPRFPKIRRECAEVAELTAKRDILCARSMRVSAKNDVAFVAEGDSSRRTTTSVMEILSGEPLPGASVVASAESWDAATCEYQVAVAVAWSKKLVSAAVDAAPPPAPASPDEDRQEWDKWLSTIDLSVALGMRQFVDSHGRRRFAGIGCANAEGKTGAALNAARVVAETEAKASLALGLYGDTEMRSLATSAMREAEAADGTQTVEAWESFVGRIRAQCGNRQIRGGVVHTAQIAHPVTRRQMIVCVYGMTAADQAEMNLKNSD